MTNVKPVIKKGRKFDQVLAGARTIFLRDGFEGASVDDIAREAKVSKATLYSYFSDKRLLFLEVAAAETRRQADAHQQEMDQQLPPEVMLPVAGRKIFDFITSDFGQAVFRIAVAESARFPELGQHFFDSGPALVRDRLAAYFKSCVERGELYIDDLEFAAEQFADLCKVRAQTCCIFKGECNVSPAERDLVVDGAVGMFLSHYGTGKRSQKKAETDG